MRRILSVLLENESGALSRVVGFFHSAVTTLSLECSAYRRSLAVETDGDHHG